MRTQRQPAAHPFALMMEPQTIVEAMERSTRLGSLNRRICRPLDKPLIPKSLTPEMAAFDREVDGRGDVQDDPEH